LERVAGRGRGMVGWRWVGWLRVVVETVGRWDDARWNEVRWNEVRKDDASWDKARWKT
jgi:hypothetical protein